MYDNNAVAIMMLCCNLTGDRENPSLNSAEWDFVAHMLDVNKLEPSALLDFTEADFKAILNVSDIDARRMSVRIQTGRNVLSFVEELRENNVYLVTRADAQFPGMLRRKLGADCPPVLYYTGNIDIANMNAVAISGSRNPSAADVELACTLAQKALKTNMVVVTGGGTGIELDAERVVYENNGYVMQFCAGSLYMKKDLPIYSQQLREGRLLAMSAVSPKEPFCLEYARYRNKCLYASAENAFIIRADKGHVTYLGAQEAVKRKLWEVYCWNNPEYLGNIELIKMGAHPFNATVRDTSDR